MSGTCIKSDETLAIFKCTEDLILHIVNNNVGHIGHIDVLAVFAPVAIQPIDAALIG